MNFPLTWAHTFASSFSRGSLTPLLHFCQEATSLEQWEAAAQELDLLEGNDKWKLDPATDGCNTGLIESCLKRIDEAREDGDARRMVYLMRTAMSRDLGGMGKPGLYHHCHIGTKQVIERYVDSATDLVESLMSETALSLKNNVSYNELLEGLLLARQSFGRSALLLSGGGTFGMAHIGVVKTLFEADLLPRIISGSSAGSIVGAVLCSRTDEEIPRLIEEFPYGDLDVFGDNGCRPSVLALLRKFLTEGSWSDISNLTRVMQDLVGDMTFQEAYNRTRRILNITVSSEASYELPRLLNYVTAPNVMIWSAVAASCSVPVFYTSATLLVKDPFTGRHIIWNPGPQRWIDGSVANDLPMERLAETFNVNHFIVSQVNPHVVPFLAKEENIKPYIHSDSVDHGQQQPDRGTQWSNTMTNLARAESLHRLDVLAELRVESKLIHRLRSILNQRYSGDINILPEIPLEDFAKILTNPTSDFMLRTCLAGERAAWPKISRIRDRCAIEMALDRAVISLRARVVFSASQVDLRRMATGPFSGQLEPEHATSRVNEATQTDEKSDNSSGGRQGVGMGALGSSAHLFFRQCNVVRDEGTMDNDTEGGERREPPEEAGQRSFPGMRSGLSPPLLRAARSYHDDRTSLGLEMNPTEQHMTGAGPFAPRDPFPMRILDSPDAPGSDDYRDWLVLHPHTAWQACDDGAQTGPVTPIVRPHATGDRSSGEESNTDTDISISDPDPYSE